MENKIFKENLKEKRKKDKIANKKSEKRKKEKSEETHLLLSSTSEIARYM